MLQFGELLGSSGFKASVDILFSPCCHNLLSSVNGYRHWWIYRTVCVNEYFLSSNCGVTKCFPEKLRRHLDERVS